MRKWGSGHRPELLLQSPLVPKASRPPDGEGQDPRGLRPQVVERGLMGREPLLARSVSPSANREMGPTGIPKLLVWSTPVVGEEVNLGAGVGT